MPREVLTMGIDASREPADNDATAEERMEAQRQARRAVDDAYGDRGSDAEGTRRDLADSNLREGELPRTVPQPRGDHRSGLPPQRAPTRVRGPGRHRADGGRRAIAADLSLLPALQVRARVLEEVESTLEPRAQCGPVARMMPGDGNQPMPTLSEQRRFLRLGQPVAKPAL
jgi:hypothetical protein